MNQKGFTIIELIMVLVIASILLSISLFSLNGYRNSKELAKDRDLVIEIIREARNLTIVSKNALAYGVHFDPGTVVLYIGPTYSTSTTTNKTYEVSGTLTTEIPGGGSDILFSRVSGEAVISGTARIHIAANDGASTTLRVYRTGVVEQE